MTSEQLYQDNLRLGQIEYLLQHIHLRSQPRCLGLVLSNRCNIGCIHCYQSKNGDNLLHPAEIGQELRREFIGLYPYLSTLRLQGGELFVIPGFSELLDDLAATVNRPILSISTNGTLIDEQWAERIVRLPFQNVTFSIDGGMPETYSRLRRGADLHTVLANVRRVQRWKDKLGSPYPYLDAFFVVMRSNFREIPRFLEIARDHGIATVCFQTVEINHENSSRFPSLAADEVIASKSEILELHAVLRDALEKTRGQFHMIRYSGLTSLFEQHGLDCAMFEEQRNGLYPDSDDLPGAQGEGAGFELCPNPWTTLFVVENGDVHLCFLAQPIGNLYEAPLAAIWNSPQAVMKRSHMIAGRYMASGCSSQWCGWREGSKPARPLAEETRGLLTELKDLNDRAIQLQPARPTQPSALAPVRRMLTARDRRIAELEAMFQHLCETNQAIHERGQAYINELEHDIAALREQADAGILASAWAKVRVKLQRVLPALALAVASAAWSQEQLAHFHHVHLNATDPAAAIDFYTSHFDCEKAMFVGSLPAVWAQKSWLLFTPVTAAPKSEITSAVWHIGWGAENMPEAYQKQLDRGTRFATPITDISDIGGGTAKGIFFYAYVDGPDGQLIEFNTANHHRFGHIHMLSKDPIAAGEWYIKEFGLRARGRTPPSPEPRLYRGFQIGPSMSLTLDNVNFIIYPWQYAQQQWPDLWKDRTEFESTQGHVMDHLGFSVDHLDESLERLRKDGVKITGEPRTILGGKVKSAFIEGPDKVRIELVEIK